MNRLDIPEYLTELDRVAEYDLPWSRLSDKTICISGATGMIGSFLIDVIMRKNDCEELGCTVVALGRNKEKAVGRLPYFGRSDFLFVEGSVVDVHPQILADFVVHLASSTHPRVYASDPVGTIKANVGGLGNLLEYATECDARLLFASSVEVYGENRGDIERFDERYCGYIDCNTLRACYTESKRLGEAMCQAYRSQRGVEVVIPRIARVFGPTLQKDDSKALSQFIHQALAGEDVVLKSAGDQRFSYLYVADAVSGVLAVLLNGDDGEAYNLADPASDITLRDLAGLVADISGVRVVFDVPDAQESAGYSKVNVALMDSYKARSLGWRAQVDLRVSITSTLDILRKADRA